MAEKDLLNEIRTGESKILELKENLPTHAERYVKTIIAFSNSAGGKLIVGVRDSDYGIVGVENAPQVADAVVNAVDDLCEPQVAPRIRVENISGCNVVVVEVQPGSATPYHLKGVDPEESAYVRIGATTRLADETALQELRLRGALPSSAKL